MDSLKEKTAKGLFWGAINSGTTQLLNIVFGIFLARLLSPGEYGIVGMLSIFTAIAGNLQDSGFSNALVNIKDIKDRDYNAVFWFNIIISICLYIILFFCAPLIANYFHQPCLVSLSRFVFLTFVISSFGIAQGAYMFRNLMNKEKAIVAFIALIGSGIVGIVLAMMGFSYWSLAWQQVLFITITNIGRFMYSDWRPSLKIDISPIKNMFNFSYKILITTIVNTISQNILVTIFGHIFKPSAVGNFTQANKWNTNASNFVTSTISQVAQPVLASIRDEKDRERRVFRKMMRFTAFLAFPAMFGLVLVAHEFIITLISYKWEECVSMLQILCIGGAFLPFVALYQNLAISHGRSDIYLWTTVAQVLLQFAIIFATHNNGMTVMITAFTAFNILWLAVWQIIANSIIGVTIREVAKDILPFMCVSAGVMAATYFVTLPIHSLALLLIVRIVMACLLYFTVMRVLKVKILQECIDFIKQKKNR